MIADVISLHDKNYTPRVALLELIARVDQMQDITCVITTKDGKLNVVRSLTTPQDVAAAAVFLNDFALQLLKEPA